MNAHMHPEVHPVPANQQRRGDTHSNRCTSQHASACTRLGVHPPGSEGCTESAPVHLQVHPKHLHPARPIHKL